MPGSVSKYCLQHSPVPVIVVRPTYKREKKKKKRQADPNRKGYMHILEKSGVKGGHTLDRSNRNRLVEDAPVATDNEAEAVAAAIGLAPNHEGPADFAALNKVQSAKSDANSMESPSSTDEVLMDDPKSPGLVMKSPGLSNLDSPALSETDSSEDDSDGEAKFEAVSGSVLAAEAGEEESAEQEGEEVAVSKGIADEKGVDGERKQ